MKSDSKNFTQPYAELSLFTPSATNHQFSRQLAWDLVEKIYGHNKAKNNVLGQKSTTLSTKLSHFTWDGASRITE